MLLSFLRSRQLSKDFFKILYSRSSLIFNHTSRKNVLKNPHKQFFTEL